jgi:hypothetical protein
VDDEPRMRVKVAGRRLDLTSTEFELLATLVRQPGRIFTRAIGVVSEPGRGTTITFTLPSEAAPPT